MTETKKRGRKKEIPTGRKIGLFLTEEMIWGAYLRGGRNASKGVRIALDFYKAHHPTPVPVEGEALLYAAEAQRMGKQ